MLNPGNEKFISYIAVAHVSISIKSIIYNQLSLIIVKDEIYLWEHWRTEWYCGIEHDSLLI